MEKTNPQKRTIERIDSRKSLMLANTHVGDIVWHNGVAYFEFASSDAPKKRMKVSAILKAMRKLQNVEVRNQEER